MELAPWILIVSLWLDDPPKIIPVYAKVYDSYQECMEARKNWHTKFVAICGLAPKK